MKEFSELRTSLQESFENLEEHVQGAMPPNILILRRKTVRQFPNQTMVALYYNDKLDQYFSIPYGGNIDNTITPASLKEEELEESRIRKGKEAGWWMSDFEKHVVKAKPEHAGKIDWDTAHYLHSVGHTPKDAATLYHTRRRDRLEEGKKLNSSQLRVKKVAAKQRKIADREDWAQAKAENPDRSYNTRGRGYLEESSIIDRLRSNKDFKKTPIYHRDGTTTHVDPTTANVLLKVHDSLHPDNREKFAHALGHSKPKFHKMLDFAWAQVK